eukprot:9142818-Alexandrium_andersonii.AAC.1
MIGRPFFRLRLGSVGSVPTCLSSTSIPIRPLILWACRADLEVDVHDDQIQWRCPPRVRIRAAGCGAGVVAR